MLSYRSLQLEGPRAADRRSSMVPCHTMSMCVAWWHCTLSTTHRSSVQIPAAPLPARVLLQCFCYCFSWEAVANGWSPCQLCVRLGWSARLLASARPGPGCCGHCRDFDSRPGGRMEHSLSLFHSYSIFQVNKSTHTQKKKALTSGPSPRAV